MALPQATLLALRPSLPSDWDHAEVTTPDLKYTYEKAGGDITVVVNTPVQRKVRVEIPVRGDVKEVKVDGKDARYSQKSGINSCRVIIESGSGRKHRFVLKVEQEPTVVAEAPFIVDKRAKIAVNKAKLRKIIDPQQKIGKISIEHRADDTLEAAKDWHHWAGTYNEENRLRKLYRDGTKIASETAHSDNQTSGKLCIAGSCGLWTEDSFKGILDEVAIFNIVLTKNDIQAIMDKGFYPAFPSGKLATVWAKIKSR